MAGDYALPDGPAEVLQAAIKASILGHSGLSQALKGGVHDEPPASKQAKFPRVTFGPTQRLDADSDCINAGEHIVQLDVWSRDQGRKGPCRNICDAVVRLLHRADLVATPPYGITAVRAGDARVFDDADGKTAHGVVTVRAVVQEG